MARAASSSVRVVIPHGRSVRWLRARPKVAGAPKSSWKDVLEIVPLIGVAWAGAELARSTTIELNRIRDFICAGDAARPALDLSYREMMLYHDWRPMVTALLIALSAFAAVCVFVAISAKKPTIRWSAILVTVAIVVIGVDAGRSARYEYVVIEGKIAEERAKPSTAALTAPPRATPQTSQGSTR